MLITKKEELYDLKTLYSFIINTLGNSECFFEYYYVPANFSHIKFFKYLNRKEYISNSFYDKLMNNIHNAYDYAVQNNLKKTGETIDDFLKDEIFFAFALGLTSSYETCEDSYLKLKEFKEKSNAWLYLILQYLFENFDKVENKEAIRSFIDDVFESVPNEKVTDDGYIIDEKEVPELNIFSIRFENKEILLMQESLNEILEISDDSMTIDLVKTILSVLTK